MIEQFMEKVAMEKVALRRAGKEALKSIDDYMKLTDRIGKYKIGDYSAFRDAADKADKAATAARLLGDRWLWTTSDMHELRNALQGKGGAEKTRPTFHKNNYRNIARHTTPQGLIRDRMFDERQHHIETLQAARRYRIGELQAEQELKREYPKLYSLATKFSQNAGHPIYGKPYGARGIMREWAKIPEGKLEIQKLKTERPEDLDAIEKYLK